MSSKKARGELIRQQILRDVAHHPDDIAAHISRIFSITRQAVNKHIRKLTVDGWLIYTGSTKGRRYHLGPRRKSQAFISLTPGLSEDMLYYKHVEWVVQGLPHNIFKIIEYGFMEMMNNVIDHSDGSECFISIDRELDRITVYLSDNGEGIFKRIKRLKNLEDERQALVELHKGKLTTDPENHSGQGIFFTSKMFDAFVIWSYEMEFSHYENRPLDVFTDRHEFENDSNGTSVLMQIPLNSMSSSFEVFQRFTDTDDDNLAFNKTIIPVAMARFGHENLVSRSQARRLLSRLENFQFVIFDFADVPTVGQSFADQIFRVYRLAHPEINISHANGNAEVVAMIRRAESDLGNP